MTDAEINQLRDLLRAATPGPWATRPRDEACYCVSRVGQTDVIPPYGVELLDEDDDAALIVAAVNALRGGLLDEVERLRAMLSAAGCMMPPASGVIQLDTNDRAALDAAIDADMDGEPDDRQ